MLDAVAPGEAMNQQETNQVWRGILDAERLTRYYSRLAERFSTWNRRLMWLIAVLSSAAVATLFAELPGWTALWVPAAFSIPAAALALWASYADYSRKAGLAAGIASLCMELVQEWEPLWLDVDADDVPARARELAQRLNRITTPALQQHGFVDDKLNKRCFDEANEYWQSALAA